MQEFHLKASISLEHAGKRFDQALALSFPEHSRSRLKDWIDRGWVKLNGQALRPKDKVQGGEAVEIEALINNVADWEAEPLPLTKVYEDPYLLIINKPAGLVVHPAIGNRVGTLVNALLYAIPELEKIPRAGIVHRLDKDTTGLMVVAKTLETHTKLVEMLQARRAERCYEAIVCGRLLSGATVDAAIGRHPHDRKRMCVLESGKPAMTHYRVREKFDNHTALELRLETGRTHQIRVHMNHIHHPVVGDKTYGGRLRLPPNASKSLLECLQSFPRQALHAKRLSFVHPMTEEPMTWEVPLPEDMQMLLEALRNK